MFLRKLYRPITIVDQSITKCLVLRDKPLHTRHFYISIEEEWIRTKKKPFQFLFLLRKSSFFQYLFGEFFHLILALAAC